ncbi:hypothetical protein KP509_37G028000 [Ceratopteris richardii]|uniref:Pectate lyase superfamily protein domain-containing protein n=1 Tax=Ceratopteris richardii TaxID=49495 RepID=A0A8T2Q781_CERRI|nr:hypothetical protein KP509_37G028000 [Ceratopteris richardii]
MLPELISVYTICACNPMPTMLLGCLACIYMQKMQRIVFVILFLCIPLRCTVLGNQQTECCHKFASSLPAVAKLFKKDFCSKVRSLPDRKHIASIEEFGGVGDGKTLNTKAFHDAISYLSSFADQGGSQLYIPPGIW